MSQPRTRELATDSRPGVKAKGSPREKNTKIGRQGKKRAVILPEKEEGYVATESTRKIREGFEEMAKNPRSGVEMCHKQGKTAVYLSDDETEIISEPPEGPITRKPYKPMYGKG